MPSEPEVREIESVTIAGREIPAARVVCPACQVLDLDSAFDTQDPALWRATCSRRHSWRFPPTVV